MNKKGTIVIIEDDEDDIDLIQLVIKDLAIPNPVVYYNDGEEAFQGLKDSGIEPFLIISDINMPRLNGIQLRDKIQQEGALKLKAVPYLFLTTAANPNLMLNVYSNSVQGFFTKPRSINELKRTFNRIFEYWTECSAPTFQ